VNIQQFQARQSCRRRDRAGDGIGNVVILEVEEHADAKVGQLADSIRPFHSEQLYVDFEKTDQMCYLAGQSQRFTKGAKVQCYYEFTAG